MTQALVTAQARAEATPSSSCNYTCGIRMVTPLLHLVPLIAFVASGTERCEVVACPRLGASGETSDDDDETAEAKACSARPRGSC
jgi:hypothetical protein